MSARGQPTVVTAVSTCGTDRTVLDEARAGEEVARRELMQAAREAEALAAMPVAVGRAVASPAADASANALGAGGEQVPVVEAVAVVDVAEDAHAGGRRPKGGVAALVNTMRIS